MSGIPTESLAEYIVVEYRWVFAILLLMPLSALWKVWSIIRNDIVFKLNSAPKLHDKKVQEVQRQIKKWLSGDRKTKLCTARPSWQTMCFRHGTYKKTFTNISVNLVDVLEVDTQNMTVRCEPLVTMGLLSRTLETLGFAIPVVPELDQLTVGGLVMGTGLESSSHIHGLFQHICLQYELVLADGSVVTCSKDENPDLFYTVPWSYGTIGFLTSVVIKIVPAKKYVKMQYFPYDNLTDLVKRFNQESTKPNPHQFIEALLYTKDSGVVMLADMVDEIGTDGKFNPIGKWHTQWFYKQVEKHLTNKRTAVEYIPLRDYYHRHTKSLFWEIENIIPFGNNIIFRYLFGWLMPPEVSLLKLTQTKTITELYNKKHVIQDMLIPVDHLEKAIHLFHDEFEIYPVWLCPFKVFNNPGQLKLKSGKDWQMFVDIGLYGVPKAKNFHAVKTVRRAESFAIQNHGFQLLCGDTYTTGEEFRQMFDHTLYDKVRESLPYCLEAFPETHGKVSRTVRK